MIRAIIAATLLTAPAYAGGLAPERSPPERVIADPCPPHTPWTECGVTREDGPQPVPPRPPRPPRVPPQYPPVPPVVEPPPVKEPPTPKPCRGGAPGGC